ncbi:MAG: succinate dehydrogenase [Dehalococcoidia bacterium]
MPLQRILATNNRADLLIDMAELFSGLMLVGFLWTHMLFVGTVLIGSDLFNQVPKTLEAYFLAQIGIPFVILLILAHMVLAGRRIPNRFRDMKIMWKHTRTLNHWDTWTWLFQVATGGVIGILAAAHIWTVVSRWDINMEVSSGRVVQSPYFVFYIFLLRQLKNSETKPRKRFQETPSKQSV